MQARFIGDPRNDGAGPEGIVLWGHAFRKGEWTAVENAELFARLEKNNHFETRKASVAEPAPKPVFATDPDLEIPHRGAPKPEGKIPSNWRDLHHSTRIKLAKELDPDLASSINSAAEADDLIEWHEAEDGD
ncbi:MAG: hypothetical protein CML03_00330 [Pseudooceanicola sp.]|jgi:hypothetical protein|nr:hypothetical protein [Pseudooceanicola sp.]|tara:strand:- start:773 stop:1168 length:396 start_codon:yes stop_codon:yes gene_type:complete